MPLVILVVQLMSLRLSKGILRLEMILMKLFISLRKLVLR